MPQSRDGVYYVNGKLITFLGREVDTLSGINSESLVEIVGQNLPKSTAYPGILDDVIDKLISSSGKIGDVNVINIIGPTGSPGLPGPQGVPGENGLPGIGITGPSGEIGATGINGENFIFFYQDITPTGNLIAGSLWYRPLTDILFLSIDNGGTIIWIQIN